MLHFQRKLSLPLSDLHESNGTRNPGSKLGEDTDWDLVTFLNILFLISFVTKGLLSHERATV